MADFKTALETLAKGEIKLESLSKQMDSLLKKSPKFANKMLLQLDEVYEQKKLDDKQYAHLKCQINQFRRSHATETEAGAAGVGNITQPEIVSLTVFMPQLSTGNTIWV